MGGSCFSDVKRSWYNLHDQIQEVYPRGMRGFFLVYGGELRFPKTAGAPAFAEALKSLFCSKPPLAQDKHPAPGIL